MPSPLAQQLHQMHCIAPTLVARLNPQSQQESTLPHPCREVKRNFELYDYPPLTWTDGKASGGSGEWKVFGSLVLLHLLGLGLHVPGFLLRCVACWKTQTASALLLAMGLLLLQLPTA